MGSTVRESINKTRIITTGIVLTTPHVQDDIELLWVKDGSCTAVCDGKNYALKKNDYLFCFPNQLHFYPSYQKGSRFFICIIKPSMLLQYESIFLNCLPVYSASSIPPDELDKLNLISNWIYEKTPDDGNDIFSTYVTLLFGILLKHIDLKPRTTITDSVSNVIHYCSANYKKNISISSIAEELHISKSYVSYIFSKYMTSNFNRYINSLRINDAINMLKYSEHPISYISDAVGFNSVRSFDRAFCNECGMTPSEFKRNHFSKPHSNKTLE